jgi:hypothetical protein
MTVRWPGLPFAAAIVGIEKDSRPYLYSLGVSLSPSQLNADLGNLER